MALLVLWGFAIYFCNQDTISTSVSIINPSSDQMQSEIQEIFDNRNKAILEEDVNFLNNLYNRKVRNGLFAYEHELKKMKYLNRWAHKQSVTFSKIDSKVFLRNVKKKGDGYSVALAVSTEYEYEYNNSTVSNNSFRLGTYHSLDLIPNQGSWMITKEWYIDPFADSLDIDKMNIEKINQIISSSKGEELSNLNARRLAALDYVDKYCGVARPPDYSFHYNKNYRNYNSVGGDCANFASQMIFEGSFKKNYTWNYQGGKASKAWINAHSFNSYMLYSGRGSLIQKGTYEQVLKNSYKLLPGDYIAYEKKGKVAHISVVSGIDSLGYALVNSHNTDRFRVPWDLGWSNEGIKFWLVHVNY